MVNKGRVLGEVWWDSVSGEVIFTRKDFRKIRIKRLFGWI
jgi:hypothetical protein